MSDVAERVVRNSMTADMCPSCEKKSLLARIKEHGEKLAARGHQLAAQARATEQAAKHMVQRGKEVAHKLGSAAHKVHDHLLTASERARVKVLDAEYHHLYQQYDKPGHTGGAETERITKKLQAINAELVALQVKAEKRAKAAV